MLVTCRPERACSPGKASWAGGITGLLVMEKEVGRSLGNETQRLWRCCAEGHLVHCDEILKGSGMAALLIMV